MADVTEMLDAAAGGDAEAAERILPLVYAELRRLAACRLAQENPGQTLEPTALVHEAYLRLVRESARSAPDGAHWKGRAHFFAAATEAMRRILVEIARRKKRQRHGGVRRRVEFEERDIAAERPPEEFLAIDEALTKLAEADREAAEVVKLRFYAGLSIEEAADILGISRAGAYRHWTYARAWLKNVLGDDESPVEP
jgi:RNA polymerase sigma factor (TIGR02999 family)